MTNAVKHKIYLPKRDTPEEALKAYGSIERAFILEVAERFAAKGTELFGENWFATLLQRDDHFNFRNQWKSPWDPTFLFGELLQLAASPLADCMPRNQGFYTNYDKCRRTRNSWAHDFYPRHLEDLKRDILAFKLVGVNAGLNATPYIDMVGQRISAIHSGNWPPLVLPETEIETGTIVPEAAREDFEKKDRSRELEREEKGLERPERPVVGGRWIGEAPTRHARLQISLKDVVDTMTGSSLRAEMGSVADETIHRWVQLRPSGDLLIDDIDNAVMGWVEGVPRLIGYLGGEPALPEGEIRGFLHPFAYVIDAAIGNEEGSITDVASGLTLARARVDRAGVTTQLILSAVTPADEIYVSTYGDIVRVGDEGIVKILSVSPAQWFPGQL
jgi:hypothetical protein